MTTVVKPGINNLPALGQKQISANTPYAQPADKVGEESKTLKDVRDKFAKKADIPTSASAEPGKTDLPAILKQVDPSNKSSVLPSMFSQLSKVNSILNSAAPSTRKLVIEDALSDALIVLTNKYGFLRVINTFDSALDNNGILFIDEAFRSIVQNAIANLIQTVSDYGEDNLPIKTPPELVVTNKTPSPLVSVVPDLYIKQFYTSSEDPYPGYIKWLAPDGLAYVWTRRGLLDYPYESSDEEILSLAELELAIDLDPYIANMNLTAIILNYILLTQDANIDSRSMENNVGKNSSSDLLGLAESLVGDLGTAVNSTITSLANSVLSSTVSTSLDAFTKNMTMLSKMKNEASEIIKTATSLQNLPGVSSLNIPNGAVSSVTNILSKLGVS